MNENNNNSNVTPYRASGNLNTVIGNPSVNINNMMDVNIQIASTNSKPSKSDATDVVNSNGVQIPTNAYQAPKSHIVTSNVETEQAQVVNNAITRQNNIPQGNNQYVQRTYVGNNGTPKKKKIQFNIGSEFKMVILIIVILLVFILLLPIFTGF